MATAALQQLRFDLDLRPSAAALPLRFLCGCRDCAFSREEMILAATASVPVLAPRRLRWHGPPAGMMRGLSVDIKPAGPA